MVAKSAYARISVDLNFKRRYEEREKRGIFFYRAPLWGARKGAKIGKGNCGEMPAERMPTLLDGKMFFNATRRPAPTPPWVTHSPPPGREKPCTA